MAVNLLLLLIGLIITWSKVLTPNSAKAAEKFIETTSDPLSQLKEHFSEMTKVVNCPICVFIDDLDRCQASYIVELLEGIQTLFRADDVIYVAIADRDWLCSSYAKVYEDFSKEIDEVGKPLGYFYLDKIFLLSFSLPPIGLKIKSRYWKALINQDETIQESKEKIRAIEENAEKIFNEMPSGAEIGNELNKRIEEVESKKTKDMEYEKEALKRAAVLKFHEPDSMAREFHVLEEFAPLLEPNPRAMKRLVNEYSMDWTIDKLYDGNIQREKLAKWAILKLRWPLLAEHFLNHPSDINLVETDVSNNVNIPKKIKTLFTNVHVINVVKNNVVNGVLDEKTIKQLNYSDNN